MKNKPIRNESNSKMTISLPVALLEKIDEAARKDRRNRSQYLVVELEKLLAEIVVPAAELVPPTSPLPVNRGPRAIKAKPKKGDRA
jgi:hypothetical protein